MKEMAVKEQFTWLARLGYASRGTIYLVIGALALTAALGNGGKTTDSKGAIMTIIQQPFGNVMLVTLILGLLGYVAWRFTQAVRDADGHGTDFKGLAIRTGLFASAIGHLLLAFWAARLLLGDSSSGSQGEGFIASGLGQIIISIAGVAAIGAGVAHIYKGWTARFERYMHIPAHIHNPTRQICRFGLAARGVVWCIVGWFLLRSALLANSNEITGMAEALRSLTSNTFGPWILGVVAAGLVAFGIYSFVEAMYRRINVSGAL